MPLVEMMVLPGKWKRQKTFRLEKTQLRPAQAPQQGPKPLVSLVVWGVVDGDCVIVWGTPSTTAPWVCGDRATYSERKTEEHVTTSALVPSSLPTLGNPALPPSPPTGQEAHRLSHWVISLPPVAKAGNLGERREAAMSGRPLRTATYLSSHGVSEIITWSP